MSKVDLTITAENQFSDSVRVQREFVFSLYSNSFTGKITLQRSFDNVTWGDVEVFEDTSTEKNGEQPGGAYYRFGCKTGDFTSGTIDGRLASTAI